MTNYILIAIAGAIGAVSRYSISGAAHRALGTNFPYGTLAANIIGCLLLGFIMKTTTSTTLIPASWRLPITVGFLGALTTFSTFSYETVKLLETSSYLPAVLNILANLIIGLLATVAGVIISKTIFGG